MPAIVRLSATDEMLLKEFGIVPHETNVVDMRPTQGWIAQEHGQTDFLCCAEFEALAEGDRGGGKTDTLLMDFAQFLNKGYSRAWRGLLLRRTYKELADIISKSQTWFPLIFKGSRYNAQEHTWTFPEGESLRLGYAEREQDYWGYHGSEYPWIGWEELSNWATPAIYLKFMSLSRSSNPGMPRRYRATTNPYGPGHGWIKERWLLPGHRNKVIIDMSGKDKPRVSIFVRLHNNKSLLDADPEYLSTLLTSASASPGLYAAWVEGSWDIVEGGMFSDVWDPKWNVVQEFVIPPSWYIDRAFDDGSTAPFSVGWFAESDGTDLTFPDGRVMSTVRGDLFHFKEWYGAKKNPGTGTYDGIKALSSEISLGIVQKELDWGIHGRVSPGPADNRIFSSEHGVCVATDLAQPVRVGLKRYPGVEFQMADKSPGSRKAGWKQLRAYMKNAWPLTRIREKPGLFICQGCVQWLRTVPVLTRDEEDLDDVKAPEDHTGDMTRYRVHNPPRRMTIGHVLAR